MDASEQHVGRPFAEMDPLQLVSYLKHAMLEQHSIDLKIDGAGHKEKAVMAHLQKLYGPNAAGAIVQYVVTDREGRDHNGKRIGFFSFQTANKWWTDQLYAELQDNRAERQRLADLSAKAHTGFGSISGALRG